MNITEKKGFILEDEGIEKEDIQGDGCENVAVFLDIFYTHMKGNYL